MYLVTFCLLFKISPGSVSSIDCNQFSLKTLLYMYMYLVKTKTYWHFHGIVQHSCTLAGQISWLTCQYVGKGDICCSANHLCVVIDGRIKWSNVYAKIHNALFMSTMLWCTCISCIDISVLTTYLILLCVCVCVCMCVCVGLFKIL